MKRVVVEPKLTLSAGDLLVELEVASEDEAA